MWRPARSELPLRWQCVDLKARELNVRQRADRFPFEAAGFAEATPLEDLSDDELNCALPKEQLGEGVAPVFEEILRRRKQEYRERPARGLGCLTHSPSVPR
jgi:hypothetical protein